MNTPRDTPTPVNIMLQQLIGSIVMGEFDEGVREYFIDLNSAGDVEAYIPSGYGILVRAYINAATASTDAIDYMRDLVKSMMP